jgi:hypothetical protein
MYSHSAYGLTIHSEVALPELRPGGETFDVVIRSGPVSGPPPGALESTMRWLAGTADDLTIWWSFFGSVRIRAGREVTFDPRPNLDQRSIRTIIMGSVMGVLLLQRTKAVFHASAVNRPGGAVGFMAHKGGGKSTTASALHDRGHDMITDDLVVLDDLEGQLTVRTGFEEVKLWPDTLEALGFCTEELVKVNPVVEKRARPLNGQLVKEPVHLRAIYVLAYGPEIAVEPLNPKEAFFAVMPHWYGAQFQGDLLPLLDPTDHLQAVRHLVDRVPVYRFRRPPDLKLLDTVARCIEGHVDVLVSAKQTEEQYQS